MLDNGMNDNFPRGTICIEDLEIGMARHLQKEITDRDIELFAEVVDRPATLCIWTTLMHKTRFSKAGSHMEC